MAGHSYAHLRDPSVETSQPGVAPAVEAGAGNAAAIAAMPPPTHEPGLLDTLVGDAHQDLTVGDDYASTTPGVIERIVGGHHPGAYRDLSVQVGLRVGKIASLGATVKLAGRVWTDDDLAFRTAMSAELKVEAHVRAWLIDLGLSATLRREWQDVYRSPRHFSIHVVEYFDAVIDALIQADEAAQEGASPSTRDERLAADAPSPVVSTTAEVGVSADVDRHRGGALSRSRTWSRYENEDGDIKLGTADRTALRIDLGPQWHVEVAHNLIDDHEFPDNDGSFVTLTVGASRDVLSTISPQAYRDLATAMAADGRQIRARGLSDLGTQIGGAWRDHVKAANFERPRGRTADTRFTGELVWHLIDGPADGFDLETQYVRVVGGFDANERVNIPVGGGTLEGGYDIHSRFRAFEMAGAGTSSYFQKFYNGLRRRDPATSGDFEPADGWVPEGWDAYAGSHQHTLWAMFANLAHQTRAGSGTLVRELSGSGLPELAARHHDALVDTSESVSGPAPGPADVARPMPIDSTRMAELVRALTDHFNRTPLEAEEGWMDPALLDGLDIESMTFTEGVGFVARGVSSDTWEALAPALGAGLEVDIERVTGPWTHYGAGLDLGPGLQQAEQSITAFAAHVFSVGPMRGLNLPYFEFYAPQDRERIQALSEQASTGYLTERDDIDFLGEAQDRMFPRFRDALLAARLPSDEG